MYVSVRSFMWADGHCGNHKRDSRRKTGKPAIWNPICGKSVCSASIRAFSRKYMSVVTEVYSRFPASIWAFQWKYVKERFSPFRRGMTALHFRRLADRDRARSFPAFSASFPRKDGAKITLPSKTLAGNGGICRIWREKVCFIFNFSVQGTRGTLIVRYYIPL